MLVTVATYNQIYLADLDKARLLDHDIPCVIQDQNMVGMNLFYSNAVGGIKLQVPDLHVQQAHDMLNGYEEKESGISIFPVCPVCRSEDVLPKRYNSIVLILSFVLFGGQTLFSTADSRYRCQSCGNIWDMAGDD
ncbi:MAG: hypothetical protein ABR545_06775 [Cyclonatronaceae bacterium]